MTLTINDSTMTSDHSAHAARRSPDQSGWEVSWLPGQILDRNTAITAMIQDLHERQRLWLFIQSWAGELGLTAPDALNRASQPPESDTAGKDASAALADPEAAG